MDGIVEDFRSMSFTIEGEVNVNIIVTEIAGGDLRFDIQVTDETGSIGDLRGLFFDLNDNLLIDGLAVDGAEITKSDFDEGDVSNLGGGCNVKGELTQDGGFDAGIMFGTSGIGKDDIQETSFTLSHADTNLFIDDFFGSDFAVRLTSVGAEDGSRDGSLKLGGTAPTEGDPSETGDEPTDPVDPPITDTPDEPDTPVTEEPGETEPPVIDDPLDPDAPIIDDPIEIGMPDEPTTIIDPDTGLPFVPITDEDVVFDDPIDIDAGGDGNLFL